MWFCGCKFNMSFLCSYTAREEFFLWVFPLISLLSISLWVQYSYLIVTWVGNSSERWSAAGTGTAARQTCFAGGSGEKQQMFLQMQTVTQTKTQGKGCKVQLVGLTRLLSAFLSMPKPWWLMRSKGTFKLTNPMFKCWGFIQGSWGRAALGFTSPELWQPELIERKHQSLSLSS